MKRRQVFVRGRLRDGSIGNIDVLDLDDASFRAFLVELLIRFEMVVALKGEHVEGERLELRERPDPETV